MDGLNQNCDEQLKIVVRKREFSVSKKFICSSVPYFEKMFCCDLLESKENRVELDFDERVFSSILDWIHTESFSIQMDYVISFYDAADYLMINDRLLKPCFSYFHEKFTIEHIPIVLQQVTKVSKLINSEAIANMICRYFLMITNTDIFLDFPIETVEAILKLDLMINSEYQIIEAIIKWVTKNGDPTGKSLQQLLNCVRWSALDSKDKKLVLTGLKEAVLSGKKYFSNSLYRFFWDFMDLDTVSEAKLSELIATRSNISSNDVCRFNRSKQRFFISIQQKDDANIRINMFDNELCCSPIGHFTRDDSMPLEFVHGEHISDILYETGTKGIRIDWSKRTFKWLDFSEPSENYYSSLIKFIVKFSPSINSVTCLLEDKNAKPPELLKTEEALFLEYDGAYILIGRTKKECKWFGIFPVTETDWFTGFEEDSHSFYATVLDNVVYIVSEDLEFIQFDITTGSFDVCELFSEDLDFSDLVLTSHEKNDDKVILVETSSGKMHVFCTKKKKWLEKCRIMDVNFCANNVNAKLNRLIVFTSTSLPMKVVKPLYARNV